ALSIAFSPDGKRLASASGDRTIKIWNTDVSSAVARHPDAGKQLETLLGHTDAVKSVAWGPGGRRLASGSADGTVRVWDVQPERGRRVLDHAGMVRGVAFSPDGKFLASASHDNAVKVWDSKTRQESFTLKAFAPQAIAFRPDGQQLAAVGLDKLLK